LEPSTSQDYVVFQTYTSHGTVTGYTPGRLSVNGRYLLFSWQ